MNESAEPTAGRYDAQTRLPGWSESAQRALRDASVFVVGAGAIGSLAAAYVAGAGVGRLAIVDGSTVDESDLARQVFYLTPESGVAKADSLAAKLSLLNPDVHVDPFPADLTPDNAAPILEGADLVLDCSSLTAVRRLVNDVCVERYVPLVTAAAAGAAAAVYAMSPPRTACCRCAEAAADDGSTIEHGEADAGFGLPSRASAGVLGPAAGAAASMQALAAVGLLTGAVDARAGTLLRLRGESLGWDERPIERTPDCMCARGFGDGNV